MIRYQENFSKATPDAALEAIAMWRSNSGEPYNGAAKELCRSWGEHQWLDVEDAQHTRAQEKQRQ